MKHIEYCVIIPDADGKYKTMYCSTFKKWQAEANLEVVKEKYPDRGCYISTHVYDDMEYQRLFVWGC